MLPKITPCFLNPFSPYHVQLHKLTTTMLTTHGQQATIDKHIIRHGVHEAIKCPNNPAEVSAKESSTNNFMSRCHHLQPPFTRMLQSPTGRITAAQWHPPCSPYFPMRT